MILSRTLQQILGAQIPGLHCLDQQLAATAVNAAKRHVWNESMDSTEARRAESFYDSTIEKFAEMPIETFSLEQMLFIGRNVVSDPTKVVQSAQFVQQEVGCRAPAAAAAPAAASSDVAVAQKAGSSPTGPAVVAAPCRPLLDLLARGLVEVRAKRLVGQALDLDNFLDAMLRSRISRRVIAEQHLHIADTRPGYIGSIATALDVADAVDFAGQRAVQVCMEAYGYAPEVIVSGDLTARLPYLPSHLDYMLYELLKNSMRAAVERHRGATYSTRRRLPPIQARVCSGGSHLTVRISDQGGGIPLEHIKQVWSYGFTTSGSGVPDLETQQNLIDSSVWSSRSSGTSSSEDIVDNAAAAAAAPVLGDTAAAADAQLNKTAAEFGSLLANVADAPRRRYSLAGLGFGLPLSRLHARYFGGDLQLVNVPGYGVDAFLTLKRLDTSGWREQHDGDVAAAGQSAAVEAAMKVQQQLQQTKKAGPL